MILPEKIFREYDIRGEVGKDLTESITEAIGFAYGTYIRQHLAIPKDQVQDHVVAVGRDVRLHSRMLKDALVRGIRRAGLQVVDVGVCPTPLLYFALFHLPEVLEGGRTLAGGVMVTGSHNPPEFNGFKLCVGQQALFGEQIQHIREILRNVQERSPLEEAQTPIQTYDIVSVYLESLWRQFAPQGEGASPRPLRVVVDCGNGTAGLVVPQIFRDMGCQVIELYTEPDGRFPHHHPDPAIPENLKDLIQKIREHKAHLGVAYDGDADRLGVVDEQGEILWGDRLMILFARDILRRQPGAVMVSEVKASQVLYDDIQRAGGRPIMWKAGHSLIKAKMRETGAVLGGEVSGHLFFADRYYGFDDAIYASCRLVEILQKAPIPPGFSLDPGPGERLWGVSQLLEDVPRTVVTPEIRIPCPDEEKFELVDRLKAHFEALVRDPARAGSPYPIKELVTVDGVRVIFDRGWGLVRPSNTQPVLVLRFEADTDVALEQIRAFVEAQIQRVQSS